MTIDPRHSSNLTQSSPTPSAAPLQLSLGQIACQTIRHYRQYGWTLTQALLPSVLKILFGLYGCLILTFLYLNFLTQWVPPFLWGLGAWGTGLIIGCCFFWLFRGSWEYIVYCASLNRAIQAFSSPTSPAHSVSENKTKALSTAYQYVAQQTRPTYLKLLGLTGFLPLIALLPSILLGLAALTLSRNPALVLGLLGVGLLLSSILGLLCLLVFFLMSFLFQEVALAPMPHTPWRLIQQSADRVRQRWLAVLTLQISLLLLTSGLIPGCMVWLLRAIHLSPLLDSFHRWLLSNIQLEAALRNLASASQLPPGLTAFLPMLHPSFLTLPSALSDTLLSGVVQLLLLPLGSIAFTLLYLDMAPPLDTQSLSASSVSPTEDAS